MPADPALTTPRKRITRPDGTVAELIETRPTSAPGRGSSRTKARKRALDILFEADLRGVDAGGPLALHIAVADPPVRPFTITLVEGVIARRPEIDALIAECLATGWTMDRMPRVDRCLARIAIWEMLDGTTSSEVVLEQAVTLAQDLSTDDSATFLNGVLARAREKILAGLG
ncbi:MAG: transcription antitermination factor NusB [Micropruina sp.]|uniref:transcription antitermination factor NusB n=1 Tax=Micropruina sp. TaxID=2737536 RepID=UPI0039E5049B